MNRFKALLLALAGVCTFCGSPASLALEPADLPARDAGGMQEPAMDPVLRALLIGMAASLLREAAQSPDPLNALGETLERKLMFALRSPEMARLVEALVGQAFRDVPLELREPLAQFAQSMLHSMRRDLPDRGLAR